MPLAPRRRTGGVSFPLGRMFITPTAMVAVPNQDLVRALSRHAAGDWGELDPEDIEANERALTNGSRLFSSYRSRHGIKFWIITEADRSATTILLPEDY